MSFSLLTPLREMPIAVVDVETTGASAGLGDRVIEIGIVRMLGGQIDRQYSQLIDPRRLLSPGISALTGITPSMLTGKPIWRDVQDQITPLLTGAAILGHNIPFDLSFIRHEYRRTGVDLPEVFGNPPVFDSVRLARRLFGRGGNGLQRLAQRLGLAPPIAHRALADALTTAGVFERMIAICGGWEMSLCDYLLQQGGPVNLVAGPDQGAILPLELEEALDLRGKVRMVYLDARNQQTERIIEPIKVRRFKSELTLVAHCQLRNDQRTFKVDRIVSLTRIVETVETDAIERPISATASPLLRRLNDASSDARAGADRAQTRPASTDLT